MRDYRKELLEACRLLVAAQDALKWDEFNDDLADEITLYAYSTGAKQMTLLDLYNLKPQPIRGRVMMHVHDKTTYYEAGVDTLKKCVRCGETKIISEFPKHTKGGRCKQCTNSITKARYHARKSKP